MTTTFFVDTNILIYALDEKPLEKGKIALQWLDELARRDAIRINLQVINEFCHVALRKFEARSDSDIKAMASTLEQWGRDPITNEISAAAWVIRQNFRYSWFDSLLLASAHNLKCSFFLSEDLQNGHDVVGLTILNPFLATPSDFL